MAIKTTSSGGGPTPTIDTSDLVSDSELASHAADTTSIHGVTDTAVLATATDIATHAADTTSVHGIVDTADIATGSSITTAVSDHSADTTSVHGITDTSALATTTVTDALDGRVDTLETNVTTVTSTVNDNHEGRIDVLEAAQGVAVVREVINVLNYVGVDPSGNTDSATGLQNAFTAAKANIGGRTMGEVFIPKGRYKSLSSLNAEGLIVSGEGMESSMLWFPTDLGTGTFGITFQTTQTATKPQCGPRGLYIVGPSGSTAKGTYPANMDGCRLGNAGLARDTQVTGFRAGINLFKDHENIEHCRVGGNAYGILFDKTQSGGDQYMVDVTCSGSLIAAIAVHPDSNVGGAKFFGCHLGFNPVPLLKLNVQGTGNGHLGNVAPGMFDVSFTATTTSASSSVTGVTSITAGPGWGAAGAIADGMRVVGTGIPAGTKIASYNSGAGTFSLQNANTGASVNATASGTVTMHAGVVQVEAFSACWFYGCSFESYGNALMYSQPIYIKAESNSFHDCGSSNPMDSNTRVSGWPATGCINNVNLFYWNLDNASGMLALGSAAVFDLGTPGGTSLGSNLGDVASKIDAVNTAGLKLVTASGTVNYSGTTFRYGSGSQGSGILGDLSVPSTSTVAVGDLLCMVDTRCKKHDGASTSITHGVAMQAAGTSDRFPVAYRGTIKINVAAANAGTIAQNKWVKPDASNAGCVVVATGPTDGDVVGKTTAADSGNQVSVTLTGIR